MTQPVLIKLNPERFPNMSLPMAAIMGYWLDQPYTTPTIVERRITSDGSVIGRTDDRMRNFHPGDEADWRANLRRLGRTAGLDADSGCIVMAGSEPVILKTAVDGLKTPFAPSLSRGEWGFQAHPQWVNAEKPFMPRLGSARMLRRCSARAVFLRYNGRF